MTPPIAIASRSLTITDTRLKLLNQADEKFL